jgi:hypothetical protein
MALLGDIFKVNPITALAVGLGAMFLAPSVLPAAGRILRPVIKAGIKGGMIVYDEVAKLGEAAGDLFTEAHGELMEAALPAAADPQRNSLTPAPEPSPRRARRPSE